MFHYAALLSFSLPHRQGRGIKDLFLVVGGFDGENKTGYTGFKGIRSACSSDRRPGYADRDILYSAYGRAD